MKLESARELYSDYTEGLLTPAMKLAFEQHLEADPAGRADYDDFVHIFSTLNKQADVLVELPLGFRAKILELAEERKKASKGSAWDRVAGWFQTMPRRRATTGVLAALAASAVIGVVIQRNEPTQGPRTTTIIGTPSSSNQGAPVVQTTITGASLQRGTDGNLYHLFHVHLPSSVPAATVNAYFITDTGQITEPSLRATEATLALKQPQSLMNDEELQIPIALLQGAQHESVLTVVVDWKPMDPTLSPGAQVIFSPLEAAEASTTPAAVHQSQNLYDALGILAAQYHVTIIADAAHAPTSPVTVSPNAPDAQNALLATVGPLGYGVKALDDHTYQVYTK